LEKLGRGKNHTSDRKNFRLDLFGSRTPKSNIDEDNQIGGSKGKTGEGD